MGPIIGFLFVLGMVFGGFLIAGGKMAPILAALPAEGMMIGGGAIGAMIIGNNGAVLKGVLKGFGKIFKGGKYKKSDYIELLCLMFSIVKVIKTKGLLQLEAHIETPHESDFFKKFPIVLKDHHTTDFICDNLRLMSMNFENPYQVEDLLTAQLDQHHAEEHGPAAALQSVSDGLPAIGIVAAVLGIIKTMGSVTEPPEILGKMIGSALVGTFLGVFLSYCLVGPFTSKLNQVLEEEAAYFNLIKQVFVTYLQGHPPQIVAEAARRVIPSKLQPSFKELDEIINNLGSDPLAS